MMLVGDLGATNCRLAVYSRGRLSRIAVFRSADFSCFEDVVEEYLARGKLRLSAGCFGVPGTVIDGTASLTNLPWKVSEAGLRRVLGLSRVRLINDFEAVGYGIASVPSKELVVLQRGRRVVGGTCVVLGAGTGLGEAIIVREGGCVRVLQSEGGVAPMPVLDEISSRLRAYLERVVGFADAESALSGAGLVRIYDFLRRERAGKKGMSVHKAVRRGEIAATIAEHGLHGTDALCVRTLDLFVRIYGAEAACLASKALAVGGVFIAGGIAPRIVAKLRGGAFLDAFLANVRRRSVLSEVPVRVVMDPYVGLRGAGIVAKLL